MHIKVYVNEKPLFLCDSVDKELEPYAHHDDTVYIDEFSTPAINSMIHEMQSEKVHAGIFLHRDLEKLITTFRKRYLLVQAGGGLVKNEKGDTLFIFRRKKWDLPKGKLDPGESLEECAIREVKEETGLQDVASGHLLLTTYHTYPEKGKDILKETQWFAMSANSKQKLVPQTTEDIEELKWVSVEDIADVVKNTYPSIRDVVEKGMQI